MRMSMYSVHIKCVIKFNYHNTSSVHFISHVCHINIRLVVKSDFRNSIVANRQNACRKILDRSDCAKRYQFELKDENVCMKSRKILPDRADPGHHDIKKVWIPNFQPKPAMMIFSNFYTSISIFKLNLARLDRSEMLEHEFWRHWWHFWAIRVIRILKVHFSRPV